MLNNMQVSAGTGEWFAGMSRDRGMVCRYEQGRGLECYAGMSSNRVIVCGYEQGQGNGMRV